jgi:hypothetical protein
MNLNENQNMPILKKELKTLLNDILIMQNGENLQKIKLRNFIKKQINKSI